ncbi:MAG: lipopolysaccharide transport periplasmic protein LptA, partial [Acinetobacter sp.]
MHQALNSNYRSTFLKQMACVTALALVSAASFALPSDRGQQLSLVADRATYNEKTGITT